MNEIAPLLSESSVAQRSTPNGLATLLAGGRAETAKALAKAVADCHAVDKDGRNTHHGYNYASADAIIQEGRRALAGAGLALLPMEASLNGSEREGPDRFELVRTFVLLHSSGEVTPLRVCWPVVPDKGRPLDKATAIADTLSLSYLLRDLLMMPRVDPSDEMNARDDRQQAAPPGKRKAAPPADGAEFAAREQKREAGLVKQGRCQPGELIAHLQHQGELLGAPAELARWNAAQIKSASDWIRTFLALHPAKAETAGEQPAPPPANGSPAATISPQQLHELRAALAKLVGGEARWWPQIRDAFTLGRLARPETLPAELFSQIMLELQTELNRPRPAARK